MKQPKDIDAKPEKCLWCSGVKTHKEWCLSNYPKPADKQDDNIELDENRPKTYPKGTVPTSGDGTYKLMGAEKVFVAPHPIVDENGQVVSRTTLINSDPVIAPQQSNSVDKIEALNKAGVPKWLIEVMKSYDGLMSTNPDKEHKWIAKRRLAKDIQDQLTLLLLEIIGEDEDEAKHIINGKAVGKNADAHTRNQLRAELRAKLTKGIEPNE